MKRFLFLLAILLAANVYGKTLHVGPGQTYSRIEDALEAAKPDSRILVHPLPNGEAYKEVKLMVTKPNLTIQAADPNQPIPLDGTGVNYTGAGSTPRAIVQFCAEGSGGTLDGFILRNAHNDTHNAAGVRISQANDVTISRCDICGCDMGIMSDGRAAQKGVEAQGANQLITHCRITDNGAPEEPGYNHNLYLGGDSVTIQYSEIARAVTGHNVKCRVHRVVISNCSIHDAANREIDLVDGKNCTDVSGSNVQIFRCSIKKDARCQGNHGCIHFGKDGGAAHDGAIIMRNNVIETPFSTPLIELSDGKGVGLYDNVFSDAGTGTSATLVKTRGEQTVKQSGNEIPERWTIKQE